MSVARSGVLSTKPAWVLVLRQWCVVCWACWLISDLSYWNIAKYDNANRSRTTAFQCTHISYAFGKCIFSYPNVWLDIFRVQLTELCSVTSQICTNAIACSSVNPSQLDLDRASIQNVDKYDKPAPVYVAEAAFLAGQDQRKITNRQWDFKAMCALKTNPCDRHKVTVSSLTKLDSYPK